MNILLTNDDGIYSEGILELYRALVKIGKVSVIAPDSEQSAVGHGITMSEPLRVKDVYKRGRYFGQAVSGTPADCVKIAIRSLLKFRPDLVISGINPGPNTGYNVLYSGTVSGATEGSILGIPSIAVSLAAFSNLDYKFAALFAARLARRLHRTGLPDGTFLNVNIPARAKSKIKGIKITRQGMTPLIERFDRRVDPRKRVYYWLTGEIAESKDGEDTDIEAVRKGFIAITPLHCDMTDFSYIDSLKRWKI